MAVVTPYMRYPHLHGDLITFTAADDIWLAPTGGGRAWRLTDDKQPVRTPRISPDGAHIAFISFRDGHPEVYVTSADGSSPTRRLTWWGAKNTLLLGWFDHASVLVASHAGEPNLRNTVVKKLDLDGTVDRLDFGPAWGLAIHPDGAVALATPGSRPPAHWKRYRGGTAPKLWLDKIGDRSWTRLLEDDSASAVDPMWVDGKLAFVSDRAAVLPGPPEVSGQQANLWVFDDVLGDAESPPRQLTDQTFETGYVRDATTDGSRVIWHSRGRLYMIEHLDNEPHQIEVSLPGAMPTAYRADPGKWVEAIAPDNGADASLVTWRGNAFWLTHREGPARALVADSSVRVREPAVLGDTGFGVVVSDAEGDDRLEIHHLTGETEPRHVAGGQLGRVLHLTADPEGKRLATISHDGRISLIDLDLDATDVITAVGRSRQGEARSPSFSPDGRYLMWSQATVQGANLHQLMVYDTESGEGPVELTSGTFNDYSPAFTRDGKHVVFLSERTFDPDYDVHEFALSFSGSTRPWLIPLSVTEPPPFGPSADGWRISEPKKDSSETDQNGEEEKSEEKELEETPDFDLEGAEDRAIPFPVPSAEYHRLRTCEAGVLWIKVNRDSGALGTRRAGVAGEPTPNVLQLWSLKKRAVETIVDKVASYAVSGDGTRVVARHKAEISVVPADRKADEKDPSVVKVDRSRLRFEVDPRAEWSQMFDETVRLMHQHFWRDDMDGIDWDTVTESWRQVVPGIASHDDLVDVLWETVGELNTSHAYVIPASAPGNSKRRLGLLGADLSRADQGWQIDRILPTETSDPAAHSPLRAAGVGAEAGDLILSVDGSPVDPMFGPGPLLVGAAGKPVELMLQREGEPRRVVVVPIDDEEVLRYQDWVRSRREYVSDRSQGRLGYLHIPDMMSTGWAQMHRDLRHAASAEGLIVDVRYNRGGHTSQLVLSRLAKQLVGWTFGRHYEEPGTYPIGAPRGPVVFVANEFSGSDGDIVNAAAQAMGLGPVVGVRTWGGVVGIDGRFRLVDGTSITQPRYAFWLEGKEWGVENYGVDPDIEVVHSPADFFSEDDHQLDRAMDEALQRLDDAPAKTAPTIPDPKVG